MRQSTSVSSFSMALSATVVFAGSAAAETLYYDANFNAEPLGELSSQSPTDPLPLTLPARLIVDTPASVAVVTSAGDLRDQPVLITPASDSLASVLFYRPGFAPPSAFSCHCQPFELCPPHPDCGRPADPPAESGLFDIQLDALVLDPPIAARHCDQQELLVVGLEKNPTNQVLVLGIKYDVDGSFRVNDGNGSTGGLGSFTVGIADHLGIVLDLDTASYEFSQNGSLLASGPLDDPANFFIFAVESCGRLRNDPPARTAFDNLTIVPEPSGNLLAAFALAIMAGLRRSAYGLRNRA